MDLLHSETILKAQDCYCVDNQKLEDGSVKSPPIFLPTRANPGQIAVEAGAASTPLVGSIAAGRRRVGLEFVVRHAGAEGHNRVGAGALIASSNNRSEPTAARAPFSAAATPRWTRPLGAGRRPPLPLPSAYSFGTTTTRSWPRSSQRLEMVSFFDVKPEAAVVRMTCPPSRRPPRP